jgi:hypothetical protein
MMAKKTDRKLALRKETLRQLSADNLARVVGGGLSGVYCTVGQASGQCGSTDTDTSALCATIGGGGSIIIRN